MAPIPKIVVLREHMANGRWPEALRLAARFPRLGEQRNAILSAHGALTNPRFYTSLGKDLTALVDAGIAALKARYDLPAPKV